MQRNKVEEESHTPLKTYFKLFFWGHSLSGSVIDGHGMSGQPVLFLQLSIEQIQSWERRRVHNVNWRVEGACYSGAWECDLHFACLAGQLSRACSNKSRALSSFFPPWSQDDGHMMY